MRDGERVTGWMQDADGRWYHFAADGIIDDGWLQDADGQWYYLSESHDGSFGRMLTGWQKVGGAWYYLRPNAGGPKGSCALDTVIDGWRVYASGRWVA